MPSQCEEEVSAPAVGSHGGSALHWWISAPLAIVLLYLALRGVEWRHVWEFARHADVGLLGLSCVVGSIANFIRAVRWRILLNAEQRIGVLTVLWANSAGTMGNNFLPARAGELLRSAMICGKSRLSKTYVLTTALAERVVDALALLSITAVMLLAVEHPPRWLMAASRSAAILSAVLAACLVVLPRTESLLDAVLCRLPAKAGIRARATTTCGQVLLGIRSLHDAGRLGRFCALTIVIWCLDATAVTLTARAFGLALPFPVALLLIAGLGLGQALPSTPGAIGITQFVTITILESFGFSRSGALAFSLGNQALGYLQVSFWGLLGLYGNRSHNLS